MFFIPSDESKGHSGLLGVPEVSISNSEVGRGPEQSQAWNLPFPVPTVLKVLDELFNLALFFPTREYNL